MLTRRDVSIAVLAAGLTFTLTTLGDEAGALLDSTAWQWQALAPHATDVGERREVVRQPTRTLDELEMHVTTLNPHTASHPPHTHPNEEMVIVKEGTLQAHVNGREIVVPAGGVRCFASLQPHAVRNVGGSDLHIIAIEIKQAIAR